MIKWTLVIAEFPSRYSLVVRVGIAVLSEGKRTTSSLHKFAHLHCASRPFRSIS